MALVDTGAYVLHLLLAGVWTGSVVFVTVAVLPAAREGEIGPDPLERVIGTLTTVSRASALLLLLSGGYLAAVLYSGAELTGTPRGHLVVTMVVLWLVLAALVEVGAARMRDGLDQRKVRTPEREARRLFQAASVVALLLLVDAGVLAGGIPV